jgi:hypothetical protein
MAYNAEISRPNPSCFLFLIDQSGSMSDAFGMGESNKSKADGVADAINRLLQNLVIKCAKEEGVRDYYNVGVIAYGARVGPAFSGPLARRELTPISEIGNLPSRVEERVRKVEDGAGGLVDQKVRFPIWFDPVANGATPMCQALAQARVILQGWLNQHPNCFPPIVINITDGEATDGDAGDVANSIKQLSSSDGEALLFNLHISSQRATPIEFPDSEGGLPDRFAKLLFRMSSPLPEYMLKIAQEESSQVSEGARGFVFNANMEAIIKFLDIGTRPSNLR